MTTFIVSGSPVPKQRPRLGRHGKVYTPKATQVYLRPLAESTNITSSEVRVP